MKEKTCIRCGRCIDSCPSGLIPAMLYGYAKIEKYDYCKKAHIDYCSMCGKCVKVCPANIPLLKYISTTKRAISEELATDEEEIVKIFPNKKLKRKNMTISILAIFFTIAIFLLSSGFLTLIKNNTQELISFQQDAEVLTLMQQVFPNAQYFTYDEKTKIYTLFDNNRNKIGYTFYGESMGYRSKIIVLVGIKDKETIENIIVISHRECFRN